MVPKHNNGKIKGGASATTHRNRIPVAVTLSLSTYFIVLAVAAGRHDFMERPASEISLENVHYVCTGELCMYFATNSIIGIHTTRRDRDLWGPTPRFTRFLAQI